MASDRTEQELVLDLLDEVSSPMTALRFLVDAAASRK